MYYYYYYYRDTGEEVCFLKGYVWLTDGVAGSHALHRLHHAGVGPVAPAGVLVLLVAHGHLDAGQRLAGEHGGHAGEAGGQSAFTGKGG